MLSELQRTQISRLLTDYCAPDPRPEVHNRLRHGFRIEGNSVELFDLRPGFQAPNEWQEGSVAKFRYVQSRRVWQLYCQHRDLQWHEYQGRFEAASFDALLAEVEDDPTGIFWG